MILPIGCNYCLLPRDVGLDLHVPNPSCLDSLTLVNPHIVWSNVVYGWPLSCSSRPTSHKVWWMILSRCSRFGWGLSVWFWAEVTCAHDAINALRLTFMHWLLASRLDIALYCMGIATLGSLTNIDGSFPFLSSMLWMLRFWMIGNHLGLHFNLSLSQCILDD